MWTDGPLRKSGDGWKRQSDETFDFIVSGAGSAGAVVAARLSESGRYRVLLLEAGPPDTNPWIHIPLGFAKTYVDERVNWKFESAPQPQFNNRRIYVPRGKTLGGTSSINGMVYMRGHPRDYDEWRQRGCVGWDWDSVLPFFKKAENQQRGASPLHGVGGPLNVSDPVSRSRLADALIAAAESLGIPRTDDFNGPRQEGVGYYQTTTARSRRWSTAKAYLEPARSRSNLVVRPGCHSTRVLIEGNRAVGVEYHSAGGRRVARASAEVIVSGGAYGSPHLLQLSGLGPAAHLREMGIEVVRDMPAVGSNLHDHFSTYLMWRCSQPITMNDLENSWARKILAAIRYGVMRSGPMAVNGIQSGVFTRSDPRLERPDIQINLLEWSTLERSKDRVKPHPFPGFTLGPVHLAPDGRGTVRLASPDPLAAPEITFGFLGSDYDMRAMVSAIKLAREIAAQPAMRPYAVEEIVPGPRVGSEGELENFVRQTGVTNHHPIEQLRHGHGQQLGGRSSSQGARCWRASRGRRLHHAVGGRGQHQRAVDHDWREGRSHDPGGCGSTRGRLTNCRGSHPGETALRF